ncbi:kinesin-like protein KIF20B [Numenius arquata]
MELTLDNEKFARPSYIDSVELPQRKGPVDVEDIKANLSADFSLLSSSSDPSRRSSLEPKGHIQVCLRVRPFTPLERENELQGCVSLEDSTSIILKPPKTSLSRLSEKTAGQMQKFTFSRVFGPETTQEEFFEGTMKQPVQDFLDGYNRLIFTYGVTNAGKTYTFQGTEDDGGILPRTMDMLFKSIQGKLYTAMDLKPHRCRDYIKLTKDQVREETAIKNSMLRLTKEVDHQKSTNSKAPVHSKDMEEFLKDSEQSSPTVKNYVKFSVWVSFFEIYNECFYDLLVPISNDKKRKTLRLAQDIKGCSYVKDLQWVQISDSKEAFRLLKLGLKHQSIASTKLNTCSSRSHSIFTVKILKIEDSGAPRVTRVNELSMCDLAGSERCTKTRNEGDRLKESGNINTSLLTLGKCISALKNCQQSKLQQHIPFRESKLTHFLQAFFSGKGKVYMMVNISQCASAYDETLNVLKFSAIAQKVVVMDTSVLPQDQPLGEKSARESSLLCVPKMPIPRRRPTILWDRSLEDVIENDDDETEEEHNMSTEESVQKYEENKVLVGEEEYMMLLSNIEELKNKLIAERKNKLLLELKIREEVIQELTQHFAKQETDFRECLSQERERLEENSERRLEIFKELVNGYSNATGEENKLEDGPCSEQAGALDEEPSTGPGTDIDLEGIIDSLQNDVSDIKKQAEAAHRYLVSLEDPQQAVGWLEKQLGKITAELTRTKEELTKKTNELTKTEEELTQKTKDFETQMIKLGESAEQLKEATEKMNTQNKRIQELMDIVEQKDDAITRLQDLISHLEETIKDYDNTLATIKRKLSERNSGKVTESSQFKDCEETVLEVGRKRCFEDEPTVEEEPPPKKGHMKDSWEGDSLKQERTEYVERNTSENHEEMLALKERMEALEGQLAALEEQCRREKTQKEELSEQIAALHLKLSASEERASGLSKELEQHRADYQEVVSELDKQKTINREQEEKIIQLNKEVEGAKQNIIDKVSQIKTMQSKVDELYTSHLESNAMDIDLVDRKDSLESQKDEPERAERSPDCGQSPRQESSFRCSVENLWEECKNIIRASSQKSQQIQELLQQVENLKKRLYDTENCNNQLKTKLNEIANQDRQSLKEKDLLNQLQEEIQKKTQDFEKQAAEDQRVIARFEEEVTNYKGKIIELECLLGAFRAKDDNVAKLEEALKEKESIILNLESNTAALQEKCANSDKKLKELNDQEANLKEEVVQLMNNLENVKQSLQEKERTEDERVQSIELLRKDLSESSALVQSLKTDLQRKEDEYTDLKEKFSDAKKQIQQVQNQVCTMRSEEKSLRSKINELEKMKNQLSEELEIKQRTILQLKKEQMNNEKLEEISKQYEKTCKDLCAKEKIIEDMRLTLEEQEQTQTEQDRVLEAKLEEINRLLLELEAWKRKCRELNNNQSESDLQQKMSKKEEKNINENEELTKLEKELKETEAKYQTERKKWLEEKMALISQVKEAENLRNREMRKFAEDRERHVKQQAEIERLAAQLVEKDSNLQKWREERDKLVEALEVQLKTLASNNTQKDKEIAELKEAALQGARKDKETDTEELRKQLAEKDDLIKELKQLINHESLQSLAEVPLPEGQDKIDQSVNKEFMENQSKTNPIDGQSIPVRYDEVKENYSLPQCPSSDSSLSEDRSEIVLDSCEVSTENGKTSRFPKPEMEIQFTPLQPNKMEVKHQGSTLPVTVKMLKPRKKRKSEEMDEDFVKSENKKNAKCAVTDSPSTSNKKTTSTTQSFRKEYSLRKQKSTSSKMSDKKKDGTLQKIGDFFQSSPTIIHSKAKKLMATLSSPKSAEPESVKENDLKPKRAKRKLYSTDISSPLDIPASSVFIEQKEKESDHLIIKRRLRSKPAK